MKLAHHLAARVLCPPSETDAVSRSLASLLSCDNPSLEIPIARHGSEEGKFESHTLLASFLKKDSDINRLLKFLAKNMTKKDKETVVSEANFRVDEHLDLFLRFEKPLWMNERKLALTTSGNCFHLTFTLAAFPKKKARAIEMVKEIFKTT